MCSREDLRWQVDDWTLPASLAKVEQQWASVLTLVSPCSQDVERSGHAVHEDTEAHVTTRRSIDYPERFMDQTPVEHLHVRDDECFSPVSPDVGDVPAGDTECCVLGQAGR